MSLMLHVIKLAINNCFLEMRAQKTHLFCKHRKNCECCPLHSLFKGHNVNFNIVVLNCQKCNQCLRSQVSWGCLGQLKRDKRE